MLNHKDFPVAPAPNEWPYVYFWHRQGRKDQPCKVTARANVMNSCRVEFPDGYVMITSRNAIRRAKRAGIEVKEMDHAAYGK